MKRKELDLKAGPDDDVPVDKKAVEFGKKSRKEEMAWWGAIEHQALANKAFKEFIDIIKLEAEEGEIEAQFLQQLQTKSGQHALILGENLLTVGQITCLAGDFYGPDPITKPISFTQDEKEQNRRFFAAYSTLVSAKPAEIKALLERIEMALPDMMKTIKKGELPSQGLLARDFYDNIAFAITARHFPHSWFLYRFYHSRYLDLSLWNFDHFGNEAKLSYQAGHRQACETAIRAKSSGDLSLYQSAFAQELFACHYLTDLFSAGHMRTPRKTLYEQINRDAVLSSGVHMAGLLAMEMHNEENSLGLMVKSPTTKDKVWKALGDDCFFDPKNKENELLAIAAMKAGLTDVFNAHKHDHVIYSALECLPCPIEAGVGKNFFPLFKVGESGEILVREEVNNAECKSYKSLETKPVVAPARLAWSPEAVFMKRKAKAADKEKERLTPEEQVQLQARLEEEWGKIDPAHERSRCIIS